jgi:hypothetical protein
MPTFPDLFDLSEHLDNFATTVNASLKYNADDARHTKAESRCSQLISQLLNGSARLVELNLGFRGNS